jgi:hypothetical protein
VSQPYTVERANRTLPYVRAVVADARATYAELEERSRIRSELPASEEDRREELRREISERAGRLQDCRAELAAIDAELEDYERGLVDFPAELDGRPIQLCWEPDEETVAFWHELDEGCHERRPVPGKSPGWPEGATASPAARG